MPAVARVGDSIQGMTTGEHNGHTTYVVDGTDSDGNSYGHNEPTHKDPHVITGKIVTGSPNVFINGKAVARAGDLTSESDDCDSNQTGTLRSYSGRIFVNGKAIALVGDDINPHNGTAKITSGSPNVFFN
ncbi:PAAR motif protein [compost metagenome]